MNFQDPLGGFKTPYVCWNDLESLRLYWVTSAHLCQSLEWSQTRFPSKEFGNHWTSVLRKDLIFSKPNPAHNVYDLVEQDSDFTKRHVLHCYTSILHCTALKSIWSNTRPEQYITQPPFLWMGLAQEYFQVDFLFLTQKSFLCRMMMGRKEPEKMLPHSHDRHIYLLPFN